MSAIGQFGSGYWPRRMWPLIVLLLVASAWGAIGGGRLQNGNLDLSRFGPCDEVQDALVRDQYLARQSWPFVTMALTFDGLALAAVIAMLACGSPRLLAALAFAIWFVSAGLHFLGFCVLSAFAA